MKLYDGENNSTAIRHLPGYKWGVSEADKKLWLNYRFEHGFKHVYPQSVIQSIN